MLWFKRESSPHQTALAMIGARPGDAVLVLGSRDPALAAAVGVVTGLNGRTLVVDRDSTAQSRLALAARDAGALLEFEDAPVTALPIEAGTFDVAVVDVRLSTKSDADQFATIAGAFRVVRTGGRVIVIEGSKRGGMFAKRDKTPALAGEKVTALLQAAGGRAVRQLAEVEGVTYFETRRP